jgi:hypothetical protein
MSRQAKVSQAVQAAGVAVSKQLRYNTDGQQETSNMVSSIPKVWEVLPRNSVPDEPWLGAEGNVEFELPEHLGKITDQILQLEVKFKSVGANGDVVLPPTTFWFKSIALLYNGQEIERVDSEDVHNETINYCTDQQFNTIRELTNVSDTGGLHAGFAATTGAWTDVKKFYLPLWANFASTAQLFPAGFKSVWKYRLTFASNLFAGGDAGITGVKVALEHPPKVYLVEQQLDEGVFNQLQSSHNSGIVYRSILRNKFTRNESEIPTSTDYNCVLTTFTTDSAGLVVYVKPQGSDQADCLNREPLDFVALRNKNNAELTINVPTEILEGFIMPTQIPLASVLTAGGAGQNNHYLICFASNLLSVLETGAMLGGYKMDGGIRAVFRPVSALTDVVVHVLSFDYAKMSVRGGVPKVERMA